MAVNNSVTVQSVEVSNKSRGVYILLAFILGYFGVHKFYVNKVGSGVLYLVLSMLSWLIVPAIILVILVLVDIITALVSSDEEFNGRNVGAIATTSRVITTSVDTKVEKDSYIDEIERLNKLKDSGILSEKEFEAKKKIILFSNKKE